MKRMFLVLFVFFPSLAFPQSARITVDGARVIGAIDSPTYSFFVLALDRLTIGLVIAATVAAGATELQFKTGSPPPLKLRRANSQR